MLTASYLGAQVTPKFKVIYNLGSVGGFPSSFVETSPGVFYGDSLQITNASGASVFRVDSAGKFKIIHEFPQFFDGLGGIQAMNGHFFGWGAYSTGGFNYQYFSMPLDGSSLNIYPLGALGSPQSGEFAIPSPDGYLYNTVGTSYTNVSLV